MISDMNNSDLQDLWPSGSTLTETNMRRSLMGIASHDSLRNHRKSSATSQMLLKTVDLHELLCCSVLVKATF